MVKQVRVRVSGRVQGVGFRYFVWTQAVRLGVHGFVRNRPDGTVEVVAEGADEAVDALLAAVRTGPRFAEVRDMVITESDPAGYRSFDITG